MKTSRQKSPRRGGYFDLEGRKIEVEKLAYQMQQPNFWQDQDRAKIISKQHEQLSTELDTWDELTQQVTENLELAQTTDHESDPELASEIKSEYHKQYEQYKQLEFTMLFSGPYDRFNALISIHAGTGGVEAQDWAEMLLRMILRYCESKEFETIIIDENRGQEAGIKSISLRVIGHYAYGNLQSEAGVHRLVRISPFDAEKMRHTSFALVEVVPELPDEHEEFKLDEKELKIETMRASGHGGQGVNTTDSAVRITHIPTGISVKCQNERSQLQNRHLAMKHLKAKLMKLQEQHKDKELAEIRGEVMAAQWGNQIRSYVLQPYKLVKDHRTNFESQSPDDVLDGKLDEFIESYLRYRSSEKSNKS